MERPRRGIRHGTTQARRSELSGNRVVAADELHYRCLRCPAQREGDAHRRALPIKFAGVDGDFKHRIGGEGGRSGEQTEGEPSGERKAALHKGRVSWGGEGRSRGRKVSITSCAARNNQRRIGGLFSRGARPRGFCGPRTSPHCDVALRTVPRGGEPRG